ncbi:MAG TPA: hypothetical protein VL981_11080 [Candidatus Methylacidiphilales bacterium]|nr:hypothetical protein [Candidatus Methylacidiphilales bacterium]
MLYLPPDPKPHQPIRASTITAILKYLRSITPRTGAWCDVQAGPGGTTFRPKFPPGSPAAILGGGQSAWPWKVYNTSTTTTGQVQINGGDGFVASLLGPDGNTLIATVNGTNNNTVTGSPAKFPQLAVTGNGVVYGHVDLSTNAGPPSVTSMTDLEVLFAESMPAADTANPATYFNWLLATVSNYATDGSGNVSFTLSNATAIGWSTLIMCSGTPEIY